MKCNNCGNDNAQGALFCSECGKALVDQPIDLDLKEINIPASSRQSKIVKVNATKKAEETENLVCDEETENGAVKLDVEKNESITDDDKTADDNEEVGEVSEEITVQDDESETEEVPSEEQLKKQEEAAASTFLLNDEMPKSEAEDVEFISLSGDKSDEKDEKIEIDADVNKMFRPMKRLDWLVVFILTAIPAVNIVMLFIWSFGVKVNRSKKTYAQMCLILAGVFLVLSIIVAVILSVTLGSDFPEYLKQYAAQKIGF